MRTGPPGNTTLEGPRADALRRAELVGGQEDQIIFLAQEHRPGARRRSTLEDISCSFMLYELQLDTRRLRSRQPKDEVVQCACYPE